MLVQLIGLPGLARDILAATIDAQPDMRVVAAPARGGAPGDDPVTAADVVIVNERASLYDVACRTGARLALVAVDAECRTAVVALVVPERSIVHDVSADSLVRLLRALERAG